MNTVHLTAEMVGLEAGASKEDINAKFNEMKSAQAKADRLEQEKVDAEKVAAKKKVDDAVEAAITAKKIKADQKDTYVSLLTADFEAGKKALDAMTPIPKISDQLGKSAASGVSADRRDWDFDRWTEEDPEGLQAMAESDDENVKAQFDKLFAIYTT